MKRLLLVPLLLCSCWSYHLMRKEVGVGLATEEKAAEEGTEAVIDCAKKLAQEKPDFKAAFEHLKIALEKFQVIQIISKALLRVVDRERIQKALATVVEVAEMYAKQVREKDQKINDFQDKLRRSKWIVGAVGGGGFLTTILGVIFGGKIGASRGASGVRQSLGGALGKMSAHLIGKGTTPKEVSKIIRTEAGDEEAERYKQEVFQANRQILDDLVKDLVAKEAARKKGAKKTGP